MLNFHDRIHRFVRSVQMMYRISDRHSVYLSVYRFSLIFSLQMCHVTRQTDVSEMLCEYWTSGT